MRRNKQSSNRGNENKNTDMGVPSSIPACEELVKNIFHNSSDINIQILATKKEKAMIVYVDGLINIDLIDRDIIAPLKSDSFDGYVSTALTVYCSEIKDMQTFIKEVLQGNTAIFYGASGKILIADIKQWDRRPVETPDAETVTRGPREGFTESIRTNTSLLRRRIRTPDLVFENIILGRQTNTLISIAYVQGIVNQSVLGKIKDRLSRIDTDAILESGYIEQYINDNSFSLISGIGATQKPDVAAAKILEGRVAIICDGTPHVLTIPQLFIEHLQVSEDYYTQPILASITRILRTFALMITILLPGMAVASGSFNQEMIASVFLITLDSLTQKIPMPIGAEILFLVLMFELLKEAGTRLPKPVGSAVTIVGALIIGDAAVNAGIVSAPGVIVVALTAIAGFAVSDLLEFTIIYRFLFLFLGGTMGLIGIGSGIIIMLSYLSSVCSFGVPILSSYSKQEMKDTVLRFPLGSMRFRPITITRENRRRRK